MKSCEHWVSVISSAWLCQQTSWNQNLSTCFSSFLQFFSWIVSIFVDNRPYGSKNVKMLLHKLQPKFFKYLLNFLLSGPHILLVFFFFFDFTIFKLKTVKFTIVRKPKAPIIWKRSDHRARLAEIWESGQEYMGYLWSCSIQGHFAAILCT